VERFARVLKLVDKPNQRSSHVQPRPRGGGLGILAGTIAALAATHPFDIHLSSGVFFLLHAALVVAAIGLWDDLQPLSIWSRLLVQGAAAIMVVQQTGGLTTLPLPPPADLVLAPLAGQILTVIWLVGVTNFFNFMDGLDGLAAGQAILTLAAVSAVTWPHTVAVVAIVIAAGSLGFLVRNWSPAKIFLGDVGSSFLGFLMAGLALGGPPSSRSSLLLLIATSLTLFLLDPVVTLYVRFRRGARLGQAHREHAYQRFVARDQPHGAAVIRLLLAVLVLSIVAGTAYRFPLLAWPSLGMAGAVFAIEWRLARTARL
jgi:UDP-N-acetylmuramyl pentapeptide phosphotransferase/UDP-N-acetylglucosamine-1-phosphate transferase